MANHTITITNRINCFGPAPSNKWNAHSWNAFVWGEGNTDLISAYDKILANAVSLANAVTLESTINLTISNSIAITSDNLSEGLTDGSGYSYVFISNTTNAEERPVTTWTRGTPDTETWTSGVVTTTTWS